MALDFPVTTSTEWYLGWWAHWVTNATVGICAAWARVWPSSPESRSEPNSWTNFLSLIFDAIWQTSKLSGSVWCTINLSFTCCLGLSSFPNLCLALMWAGKDGCSFILPFFVVLQQNNRFVKQYQISSPSETCQSGCKYSLHGKPPNLDIFTLSLCVVGRHVYLLPCSLMLTCEALPDAQAPSQRTPHHFTAAQPLPRLWFSKCKSGYFRDVCVFYWSHTLKLFSLSWHHEHCTDSLVITVLLAKSKAVSV